MKIDVLYFKGCPNHKPTVQRVKEVLGRLGIGAEVNEVEVTQGDDPVALKFIGSPTMLIDGQDIDPAQRHGVNYGFGCRTFGGAGMPSIEVIERAVQEAASGDGDDCCSPEAPSRKTGWMSSLATLPGIGVTLLPVGLCPACWPAYAGVLSALGLGFLFKTTYLLPVTALFLLVAVGALAFRARSRRGYRPFALGLIASATVLIGKFVFTLDVAMYGGIVLLVAASIWNAWPRKATDVNGGVCPACAPEGQTSHSQHPGAK